MPTASRTTARRRYAETLLFGRPDRAFFFPGVPPDISWPDFVRYSKMLAGMTGWI
jgi:hypothetical protein